ncbi:MAG: hypothetical protein JNN11_05045 [Candidatus Doudnabacteria bacterium]|nr:hypothetical protein [Candidatus Doudnabacteria bacterium]
MPKKLLFFLFVVVFLFAVAFLAPKSNDSSPKVEIKSFEECAKAGNLIMESYPRQCRTKEGVLFLETLTQ